MSRSGSGTTTRAIRTRSPSYPAAPSEGGRRPRRPPDPHGLRAGVRAPGARTGGGSSGRMTVVRPTASGHRCGRGSSEAGDNVQGFAHHPGRHLRRWGTVRLRMTLWNVAVLALILGAMGGVVRYKVQADRFAAVDRTLAERANEAGHQYAWLRSHTVQETGATVRFRKVFPTAEGSSDAPRGLPPLPPRFL